MGAALRKGKIWINPAGGCWVQCYDQRRFTGKACRLVGPGTFPQLRIRERGWDRQIRSLRIGPAAYVQCFREADFYGSVFWLLPGQEVADVARLDLVADVDSMRVFDRPPFAHEPGYGVYMLWAANQIANARSRRRRQGPRT